MFGANNFTVSLYFRNLKQACWFYSLRKMRCCSGENRM